MYDPSVGRWLEEDPEDFAAGDMNLYRYVFNEPSRWNDPSGLQRYPTKAELVTQYEEAHDLGPALNKTLKPDSGYNGKQRLVKTAFGSLKVRFTFEKAFRGTWKEQKDQIGVYVNISAAVEPPGEFKKALGAKGYKHIRLLQLVFEYQLDDGKETLIRPDSSTRCRRSGFPIDPNAKPAAGVPNLGWRIDRQDEANSPWFDHSPVNLIRHGLPGSPGSKNADAVLLDATAVFARDRNRGKKFYTLAIATKDLKTGGNPLDPDHGPTSNPLFLAGVEWGFYVGNDGGVVFRPSAPKEITKMPPELAAAMGRFTWESSQNFEAERPQVTDTVK